MEFPLSLPRSTRADSREPVYSTSILVDIGRIISGRNFKLTFIYTYRTIFLDSLHFVLPRGDKTRRCNDESNSRICAAIFIATLYDALIIMLACVHIILIYNSRGDGANRCFLHASPFSKAFSRKKSSSIAIYLYPRNTNNFFSINPFSRKVSSNEKFAFDVKTLFSSGIKKEKLVYRHILVSSKYEQSLFH